MKVLRMSNLCPTQIRTLSPYSLSAQNGALVVLNELNINVQQVWRGPPKAFFGSCLA